MLWSFQVLELIARRVANRCEQLVLDAGPLIVDGRTDILHKPQVAAGGVIVCVQYILYCLGQNQEWYCFDLHSDTWFPFGRAR